MRQFSNGFLKGCQRDVVFVLALFVCLISPFAVIRSEGQELQDQEQAELPVHHVELVERINFWFECVTVSPCGIFIMVVKGDITAQIDTMATNNDTTTNPFAYETKVLKKGGHSTVMATRDSNGNTVVTFMGDRSMVNWIRHGDKFYYGANGRIGNGKPHWGLLGNPGKSLKAELMYTICEAQIHISIISVEVPVQRPAGFQVIYAESTDSSDPTHPQTAGGWYAAGSGKTKFVNNGSTPVKINNVAVSYSKTLPPVDKLNYGYMDPSQMTQLPQYNGMSVGPGMSIDVNLPAPNSEPSATP